MVFKDYVMKELVDKPCMPKSLWTLILQEGVMTGSSVYSKSTPEDLDYILNLPPDLFTPYAVGNPNNYWKGPDKFTILYAKNPVGQIVNLILFSDNKDMQVWIRTTHIMQKLFTEYFEKEFSDKWNRVRIFRALNDIMYNRDIMGEPMESAYAVKHQICKYCKREAINFTCAGARLKYEESGVCEKCQRK